MAGDRRADRPRLRLLGAAVGAVVVVTVVTSLLFVLPAADDAAAIRAGGPVDAVVVLGGSPDVRYDAAVTLAATLPEPPPTLVLSVQYDEPLLSCGSEPALPRVSLTCFSPEPATTAGEASWIAGEAERAGWRRVVVTTSDYHVTRTRLLVERCLDSLAPQVEVLYHSVDTDAGTLRGLWRIATEWPSLLATPWDHEPSCDG